MTTCTCKEILSNSGIRRLTEGTGAPIKATFLLIAFTADAVSIHGALICSSSYLYQTLLLPARRAGASLAAVLPLVDSQQRSRSGSGERCRTQMKESFTCMGFFFFLSIYQGERKPRRLCSEGSQKRVGLFYFSSGGSNSGVAALCVLCFRDSVESDTQSS